LQVIGGCGWRLLSQSRRLSTSSCSYPPLVGAAPANADSYAAAEATRPDGDVGFLRRYSVHGMLPLRLFVQRHLASRVARCRAAWAKIIKGGHTVSIVPAAPSSRERGIQYPCAIQFERAVPQTESGGIAPRWRISTDCERQDEQRRIARCAKSSAQITNAFAGAVRPRPPPARLTGKTVSSVLLQRHSYGVDRQIPYRSIDNPVFATEHTVV
jgi:hypothetical protein